MRPDTLGVKKPYFTISGTSTPSNPARLSPANGGSLSSVTSTNTAVIKFRKKSRFWALNFYWPGEKKRLKPAFDEVLTNTVEGRTHKMHDHVERLVEYKIYKNKIQRTPSEPIQFIINKESRNWEGVVRLDKKGFIVVGDEYPRTILAFVQNKLK